MTLSHNVVVISDLHLGEDLGPNAGEALTLHIDLVEKQLVQFLRYYAQRREDGRPWKLIINGDMIDFLAITLIPAADEKASHEDREFGLRRTPGFSVRKMEQIAARHPEFFKAFARFLARKNTAVIIPGNHDAEFHWPVVQDAFREALNKAWESLPEAGYRGAPSADIVQSRLVFEPWFYYERGLAWIEHGHQYDECCSFENHLYPRKPDSEEMVMNVDTAASRYVTCYVREAENHQQEDWSFLGYIDFGISIGFRGALRLLRGYMMFAAKLIEASRAVSKERAAKDQVEYEHRQRVKQLAERWQLPMETLTQLDDLRRRPVVGNLRRLLSILMVDKLIVFVPAILISLICLLTMGWMWGGVASAAVFGLAKLGAWWSGRGRMIDPAAHLEIVSERILKRVDAKYIIMGHTHGPVERNVEPGGTYFNTGTWLPSGKPGLLSAFTHVVIRQTRGGVRAELCQWRDGDSRPFHAGLSQRVRRELTPVPIRRATTADVQAL
jgi:UDP-2,3-diacylglucosamine pyrophosphatase LpxH